MSTDYQAVGGGAVGTVGTILKKTTIPVGTPERSGEWLVGWKQRIKLTIDQDDIDAVLSNFPILVYLSTSSGCNSGDVSCVFDELQADASRKKIAVTTSDGVTQCYVEIEKWDDANEKAWLWVKVPSIADDADTDLYLYYDADHADNDTYVGDTNSTPAESVWDANFKLVYHMRDDPDNEHVRDSTGNDNDGTKGAAGEPTVTTEGKIADAQDFDGTNDKITAPYDASLAITGAFTIEAQIKPATISLGLMRVVEFDDVVAGAASYAMNINQSNGGDVQGWFYGDDAAWHSTPGTVRITTTEFHRVSIVYDLSNFKEYRNGAFVDESAHDAAVEANTNQALGIGERISTGLYDYSGFIDEIRISNTDRSAAWLKASYESERDDLLNFGEEKWGNFVAMVGSLVKKTSANFGGGSITLAGSLVRGTFISLGQGSVSIAGSLIKKVLANFGQGSVPIAGTLTRSTFTSVGGGVLAIVGAISKLPIKLTGQGAIAIASTLVKFPKKLTGSGAVALTGILVKKGFVDTGAGAVGIASALLKEVTASVGGGAVSIASALSKFPKKIVGQGTVASAGSVLKKVPVTVGQGAISIAGFLHRPGRTLRAWLLPQSYRDMSVEAKSYRDMNIEAREVER